MSTAAKNRPSANSFMRILIVTDAWHPQVNGVVRTYECIVQALKELGHETLVVSPADFPRTLPMPGYPEIRLAVAPSKSLRKIIRSFKPTSIHVATEGPLGLAARKFCIQRNIPFSTSYHTHFPDYAAQRAGRYAKFLHAPVHRAARFAIRNFHKPSSLILVATPGMRENLQQWNFKSKMHIFSRGVDTGLFYPGPKTLFRDLPGPIALYVGRVAIEKNLQAFLKADWDGTKIVVGEGPMLKDLEKAHPQIVFAGKQSGRMLAEHYRSADVFVFPSRTDTFGIVIVEALACGLPVAAFPVRGPKDIITDDALGALDEHDLAAAMRRALHQGTAEARARHVKDHYTWMQAALQFEDGLKQTVIPEPEAAWPKS